MSKNIRNTLEAAAAAGSAQLAAGIIAIVLAAIMATVGFTSAAYATIYVADSQPGTIAQTEGDAPEAADEAVASEEADEAAASEGIDEAVAEGVIVGKAEEPAEAAEASADAAEPAGEAAEAIEDDATPMYSGQEEVIEDDEVPMYSGQPGDPANILRMGIVIGILAVIGVYLILTGRLNRSITAMERRI